MRKTIKKRSSNFLYWLKILLPGILYSLFLVLVSLSPKEVVVVKSMVGFYMDKVVHAIIYTILSYLITVALRKQRVNFSASKNAYGISIFVTISLGFLLEIGQHLITKDRSFELWDIIANITGALIGIALFMVIFGQIKFLNKPEQYGT